MNQKYVPYFLPLFCNGTLGIMLDVFSWSPNCVADPPTKMALQQMYPTFQTNFWSILDHLLVHFGSFQDQLTSYVFKNVSEFISNISIPSPFCLMYFNYNKCIGHFGPILGSFQVHFTSYVSKNVSEFISNTSVVSHFA